MSVRATRLLAILDTLRGRRQPISAQALADKHEVSVRTIYRDIESLRGQGADIEGEPGMGYQLAPGFLLPPLAFTEEELEAVLLGIQWVALQGDPELSAAANRSLSRIFDTLPSKLRMAVETCGLLVPRCSAPTPALWLPTLRAAIRQEHVIEIEYRDLKDQPSQRRIWPFLLVFFQEVRTVAAWCELRGDFRTFRADRILSLHDTKERYPKRRHDMIQRWRRRIEEEDADNS